MLKALPSDSVHCCVTSPPYWGLRDYGTGQWEGGDPACDHTKDRSAGIASSGLEGGKESTNHQREASYRQTCGKCGARRIDQQIGLEATPELWVARLVEVFREVRRVLHPSGTLWLNCGDCYAGGGNYRGCDESTLSEKQRSNRGAHGELAIGRTGVLPPTLAVLKNGSGLKAKDLIGLPWLLAFALRADGWWLRQEIIWAKPNPMPESVTDRCTKSHESVFLLTKRANYFWDAEAIREPHQDKEGVERFNGRGGKSLPEYEQRKWVESCDGSNGNRPPMTMKDRDYNSAGRNKRSVWTIPTEPYPEAHFATFPTDLVKPCVLAGTSARGVCPKCGEPWERVVEREFIADGANRNESPKGIDESNGWSEFPRGITNCRTTGWIAGCNCEAGPPVPATVLDCFTGSGTALAVALELGRNAIGIELSEDYVKLARERCGKVTPGLCLA